MLTPICKKDDKKIISNYRPISVLPVISKVFENVIFDQLSAYFITNNLFSPQQYGFRKNSSTELTALELLVVAVELVPQRVNRRRPFSTLMLTLGDIVLVRLASNIIRYRCNKNNIFTIFRKSFFDKLQQCI